MESPKGLFDPWSIDPIRHADPQVPGQREGAAVKHAVVKYAERQTVVEPPRTRIPEPVYVGRFHGHGHVRNPDPIPAHRTTLTVDRENSWSKARVPAAARCPVDTLLIGKLFPRTGTCRAGATPVNAYCIKNVVPVGLGKWASMIESAIALAKPGFARSAS